VEERAVSGLWDRCWRHGDALKSGSVYTKQQRIAELRGSCRMRVSHRLPTTLIWSGWRRRIGARARMERRDRRVTAQEYEKELSITCKAS